MKREWTPGVSVGEFRFGARFDPKDHPGEINLLEPAFEGDELETYSIDHEAYVSLHDGVIVSVECFRSMTFNGNEIIGVLEERLQEILGFVPEEIDRTDDGARFDVSALGIILWIEGGRVESAEVEPIHEKSAQTTDELLS
jgi:hypothetical protein